jgi:hypothetical protein
MGHATSIHISKVRKGNASHDKKGYTLKYPGKTVSVSKLHSTDLTSKVSLHPMRKNMPKEKGKMYQQLWCKLNNIAEKHGLAGRDHSYSPAKDQLRPSCKPSLPAHCPSEYGKFPHPVQPPYPGDSPPKHPTQPPDQHPTSSA